MNEHDVALICKSLGDENRLRIVRMLTDREKCACHLLETLEISQPTLSYHMKILVASGLIEVRKDGKWAYYSINCTVLKAYQATIGTLTCSTNRPDCSCGDR